MFDQVSVDRGLEVDDAFEDPALETALCESSKETLNGIKPGCRCWREVEGEARVPCQPCEHFRVLVSGVVIEDHIDDLANWNRRFDLIEEANELLVPMPLHALPDDRSIEHVESG